MKTRNELQQEMWSIIDKYLYTDKSSMEFAMSDRFEIEEIRLQMEKLDSFSG